MTQQPNLKELHLYGTQLDYNPLDTDLEPAWPALEKLDLSNCKIGGASEEVP